MSSKQTDCSKGKDWYENVYYCTNCQFLQVETPLSRTITLPCPKCGNSYYTSREPSTRLADGGLSSESTYKSKESSGRKE